jgi:hypothetical protein
MPTQPRWNTLEMSETKYFAWSLLGLQFNDSGWAGTYAAVVTTELTQVAHC